MLEIVAFPLHTLVGDEVGPEEPTREWSYVEVEIVDLVLTPRVSEDVESYEAECGVMLLTVHPDVNTFDETVVHRGE